MEDIEALYYQCIDRIDGSLEIAEDYLIGCVTFLHRQEHGRADRDRIAEDFNMNRGLQKYIIELTIIARLSDASLCTLIASSLDLSKEVDRLKDIHSKIKNAIYDDVQAYNQTSKIRNAIKILENMEKLVNDKGGVMQPNLFEGKDGDK